MNDPQDDNAWFAAKRFGYGSGLPIAWQGWVLMLGQVGLMAIGAVLLARHPAAMLAWVVIFAFLPMPLIAAKTRGGWKWRWGGKD
ncbi:MAG: hypothetical protein KGM49_03120 [Sphingomonadales bacterium]|nr:hypothetical protein [Sphingomonadales bacterium]